MNQAISLGLFFVATVMAILYAARTRFKYAELENIIESLRRQLRIERDKLTVSQAEMEEFARLRREHQTALEQQSELALWLRGNKAEEIRRGEHNGLSIAQVCIRYMCHSLPKE
jgi:hypothetical protein